jgi:heat shock protein HtpX
MPLTFIDIERRKNWMILVFFLMLLALYAGTCFALTAPFLPRVAGRPSTDGLRNFRYAVLGAAVLLSALHILLAGYDAAAAMVRRLGARPPDPEDEVHRRLLNVMQEIHVVTGGRSTIECVVIPSLSLNALAASDLRGRSIIGITEGLLSRLNRQQLEGVIAHEAQHILSGDCLETTVAASLFGGLSSLIEKSSDSSQTGVIPPVLWPAWALVKIGQLLNLFISREREYRADAAAVRMTRDPLALAETLHLLSRSWRGAGFIGSGFEMICIVNPVATALDETEGFWADLFSTHPPIRKRIDLLLAMAHADSTVFTAKAREDRPGSDDGGYYALDPRRQWQGPFSTPELAALPWLSPLTWIASRDGQQPDRAAACDRVVCGHTDRFLPVLRWQSGLERKDPAHSGAHRTGEALYRTDPGPGARSNEWEFGENPGAAEEQPRRSCSAPFLSKVRSSHVAGFFQRGLPDRRGPVPFLRSHVVR